MPLEQPTEEESDKGKVSLIFFFRNYKIVILRFFLKYLIWLQPFRKIEKNQKFQCSVISI